MNAPRTLDVKEMQLVLKDDGVEVRKAEAGDNMTLVWISCEKGFDFEPALKGLPHDMCCCEHWGMITKGSMQIKTHDGVEMTVSEGQAFHLLPGHSPSFPEDCSFFEFTPTEHVDRLFSHMGLA